MFLNDNISQRNKSLNPPRQLHLLLTVSVDVGGKNSSLTVVSFICLYEQLLCLLLPLWWLLLPETLTSVYSVHFNLTYCIYCMSYNPCGSTSLSVYDINYLHLSFCRHFGQSHFQWSTTETITYCVSDTFAFSELYIWNDHREVRSYDISFLCAALSRLHLSCWLNVLLHLSAVDAVVPLAHRDLESQRKLEPDLALLFWTTGSSPRTFNDSGRQFQPPPKHNLL